jgi:hypothetical protein
LHGDIERVAAHGDETLGQVGVEAIVADSDQLGIVFRHSSSA